MKYWLLLILLVGCSEPIVCQNETIIREVAVLKEVKLPCNCPECPELEECPKLNDSATKKKLTFCNIQLDQQNKELFKCLQQNNTQYLEDLEFNLTRCEKERNNCQDVINNITEWIK